MTKQTVLSRRQRQAGLTLAETLLVLAIGALAIVGGTLLYLQATGSNKLNQGINQFVTLQSGIRSLYAGQSNFSGLTTTVVTSSRAAPADMIVSNGALRNVWGGTVTAVAAGTGSTQFSISSNKVPNNACARLITLNPGGTGNSGIASIAVGSTTFTATGTGTSAVPVVAAGAAVACNSTADTNTITWTFE